MSSLFCPACEALLPMPDDRGIVQCEYCGTIHHFPAFARDAAKTTSSSDPPDSILRLSFLIEEKRWFAADLYCDQLLKSAPKDPRLHLSKLLIENRVSIKQDLAYLDHSFENSVHFHNILEFADESLIVELQSYLDAIRFSRDRELFEPPYQRAEEAMRKAQTRDDYYYAADLYSGLLHYRDSMEKFYKCTRLAEQCRASLFERMKITSLAISIIIVGFALLMVVNL